MGCGYSEARCDLEWVSAMKGSSFIERVV